MCVFCPLGKPRGRQPKFPKHTMVDPGGVINISDDSSTDTDGMDTDSNSSPDSLLDNNNDDDVIFVDSKNTWQTFGGHLAVVSPWWFYDCV